MKIQQKCKRILIIMSVLLMWSCISACSSQEPSESQTEQQGISEIQSEVSETAESTMVQETDGFDSPESAVKTYLEGLKANDLKRMADTFVAKSNVDDILHQYTILCRMELNPDSYISLKEPEDVKHFLEQLTEQMKAVDFGSMKLLGFIPPESLSEVYSSDAHQNNMIKQAEKYGGDKIESCVAAIELGENKYILIFDVLECDGKWFNLQLGGILARMTGIDGNMAGTMPLDAEDEQILKRLITDSSQNLFESEKDVPDAKKSTSFLVESEGFDSPQKAAEAYLEGLKANELDQMLSTFSVESYVDHYDLQANLENVHGYVFMQQEFNLPVVNDFSRDLNIQSRKKQIIKNIVKQYAALCVINGMDLRSSAVMEEENISSIPTELLDHLDLSSLKILGYLSPEELSEVYSSEGCLDIRIQQAKVCGASEVESCVVVFELDGSKYCFCSDAVEYKDKWYIRRLGGEISTLFGIPDDFAGIIPVAALDNPEVMDVLVPIV